MNEEKEKDGTSVVAKTITTNSSSGNVGTIMDDTADVTRAAARGTIFTLMLRALSFGCTQLTFRALDPSTLGTNIKLDLILTTVLFISREGFRLALTQNVVPENRTVAWLTIPVVTMVSGSTLLWHTSSAHDVSTDYRLAGILYCLASWIEGCAEPAILFFLRKLKVPPRVEGELFASVGKTCATAVGLRILPVSRSLTVFGIAQIVYAVIFSLYLYGRAWSRPDWKETGLPPLSFVVFWKQLDRNTCYTTLVYTVQGFFKHLLTEADKILLTTMTDSYDQGVYAMGSAYGGIAARILLQPLEENARLLWSRLASNFDNSREDQQQLLRSYTTLVKLVLYVGLVFSCVAVNYTSLLLNILAGRKWGSNSEAANVLAAFCVYTAFLALNGMTEALVYAVGGRGSATAEMTKLGLVHTCVGLIFAIVASFLVRHQGTLGLVAANCVAMLVRSLYSLYFATRYFARMDDNSASRQKYGGLTLVFKLSPHPVVLIGFAVAWLATRLSLKSLVQKDFHLRLDIHNVDWLLQTGKHVVLGVLCVVGIAFLAATSEQTFFKSLSEMVRDRRSKQLRPKQD
mmetsp:Transcript_45334/g.52350  ORF Transcript_45334/g.52350 Transcript_45334/m.52350 type:complete len:573 (-) Transcript_45334:971-2689(-)|eukprot:CAMPEP_0171055026 /NCGR_PEP_ID=MMETSP0736-20130129/55533_1 /TAXON_ID=186038 /ORGANISM="Fragilariopsis kerguelensis, Strain L26-C5" /LENGTH=572 /DNA_ID=CAMNT_0011509475 /DNA_START=110 /DNA_END=1828 /DNA_ORIENTATION=+